VKKVSTRRLQNSHINAIIISLPPNRLQLLLDVNQSVYQCQFLPTNEPKQALFAGEDGLGVYRRIAEKADAFLKPDGALMLEIGYSQGHSVSELLEQTNCFRQFAIEKDFHNNDRIITAVR
jgi:hypothetical protein